MVLQVHGEVAAADVDVFDREARFIDRVLAPLLERFPALHVVFEHITTARAAEFVRTARAGVAATITPQHLLHNRNALFAGGINPHYYCLPILKREEDREALLMAAAAGDPRFFLARQRAARTRGQGERLGLRRHVHGPRGDRTLCGGLRAGGPARPAAGVRQPFRADFYGLPRHTDVITLIKESWVAPKSYEFGDGTLVPYRGGERVAWRLAPAARA